MEELTDKEKELLGHCSCKDCKNWKADDCPCWEVKKRVKRMNKIKEGK